MLREASQILAKRGSAGRGFRESEAVHAVVRPGPRTRQAAVRAEKPNQPLEPVPSPVKTEVVDHLTVPGGRREAVSEQRACWLLGLTPQAGRVCAFARAHALLSVWPQTRMLKKVPRELEPQAGVGSRGRQEQAARRLQGYGPAGQIHHLMIKATGVPGQESRRDTIPHMGAHL